MLKELHFAINKHYPDKCRQAIIDVSGEHANGVNSDNVYRYLKDNYHNPVVFMHKIAATNCHPISNALYRKIPFNIINHTQTSRPKGLAACNNLICVSSHMFKTMRGKLRTNYPLCCIRNGVNACRYEGIEPFNPKEIEGYFVTGRLNNLNKTKHPEDWVPWIYENKYDKKHWHDYLGGGLGLSRAKAVSAKRNHTDNSYNIVNMTGRIDDFNRKVEYIKRWDSFLYEINGTEGTSMSMLESLACGVPALINKAQGNIACIEDGVNGYVCPTRKDMINRIRSFIANPEELTALKKTTKKHFDDYLDAKHMAKSYIQIAEKQGR